MIEDSITVRYKGLMTYPLLRNLVREELSKDWDINLYKWLDERSKRIKVINSKKLIREFNVPIVLRKDI